MTRKSYLLPLALIALFFFSIGFAFGINGFLTPVLKSTMEIGPIAANLLIATNFLPFLLFGLPAARLLSRYGYRKTMALSFVLFAVAFTLFIPASLSQHLYLFLTACFISGIANTVLQASVNPYITFLGPIESAAQRTCLMGIANKLAWPTTTLFMLAVVGKSDLSTITSAELPLPFACIVAIFLVLALVARFAPLPEVTAAGETADSDIATTTHTLSDFPHLYLGAIALFLYVGVETLSLSTIADYATALGLPHAAALGYIPSAGMILGYLLGIVCIPRFVSQTTAMRIATIIALFGSVLVLVLPPAVSLYAIFFMALGCSVLWPALWPMAMQDLGTYTKKGAGLLTTAIAGGSLIPLLRASLEQFTASYQASYAICLPCFLFIAWYGFSGYKIRKK